MNDPLPTSPLTRASLKSNTSGLTTRHEETSLGASPRRYRARSERSVRLTARDIAGIKLLCALGAIRSDDLTTWLAYHAGRMTVGPRSANQTIARWLRLGLAEGREDLASARRVLVPTLEGARTAGWAHGLFVPTYRDQTHTLTAAAVAIGYVTAGWRWSAWREGAGPVDQGGANAPLGVGRAATGTVLVYLDMAPENVDISWAQVSHWVTSVGRVDLWVCDEAVASLTDQRQAHVRSDTHGQIRIQGIGPLSR